MREFVLANVRYWIDEFHLDGFRLDATQQIFDASDDHILAALARRARAAAARAAASLIVGENEPQHARLVRPAGARRLRPRRAVERRLPSQRGGRADGPREAYYSDYRGTPQEFLSAAKWGFLFQGQHYPWQKQARAARPRSICAPAQFVTSSRTTIRSPTRRRRSACDAHQPRARCAR